MRGGQGPSQCAETLLYPEVVAHALRGKQDGEKKHALEEERAQVEARLLLRLLDLDGDAQPRREQVVGDSAGELVDLDAGGGDERVGEASGAIRWPSHKDDHRLAGQTLEIEDGIHHQAHNLPQDAGQDAL
jgi:hypothetical protein